MNNNELSEKQITRKIQQNIATLQHTKPSKILSTRELHDKVAEVVAWEITEQRGRNVRIIPPPVGGPLSSETKQQYRVRLFKWLIKITLAASTKKPKMALALSLWLIKHSTRPQQHKDQSLTLKF